MPRLRPAGAAPNGLAGAGRKPTSNMILTLARAMVWTCAAAAAALFVTLGVMRLTYPLELDYIEGVMMDHVVRLSQGQPIFVEPTIQFIPLAYMPMFATVGSLLARVFGPHFWEIRLVSFISMLVLSGIVLRVVREETQSWTVGAAGAGILLMAFGVTGGHYDVGRPDSLMLMLAFGGLATLRFTNGIGGTLCAALLLTLAFFTKQHSAMFAIGAMAHLALNDRRRFFVFAPAILLGCVGGYAFLSSWLGPWFSFYTWDIPSHWSQFSKARLLHYVGHGLVGLLGPLTISSLMSLALPEQVWRGRSAIWTWTATMGVATGLMATLDPDAFLHVLIPTVAALSVFGPISIHRVVRHLAAWPGSERITRPTVAFLVLALQFFPLAYTTRHQRPHPRAGEALTELLDRIRDYPGPVLILYHGFYSWSAGKGSSLHQISLDDIIRSRGNRLLKKDPKFIERMFDGLRSGPDRPMIITDTELETSGSESNSLWVSIAPSYRRDRDLGWISESLNPVTGSHWTPRYVYVPADGPPGAAGGASGSDSTLVDSVRVAAAESTVTGVAPAGGTSSGSGASTP